MSPELDVDFMQVSVGALLKDIQEHARMWVGAIAKLMHSLVKPDLVELHEVPRLRAEIARRDTRPFPFAAPGMCGTDTCAVTLRVMPSRISSDYIASTSILSSATGETRRDLDGARTRAGRE